MALHVGDDERDLRDAILKIHDVASDVKNLGVTQGHFREAITDLRNIAQATNDAVLSTEHSSMLRSEKSESRDALISQEVHGVKNDLAAHVASDDRNFATAFSELRSARGLKPSTWAGLAALITALATLVGSLLGGING